ncbi:butyrophilin-like protein 1 isoform X2 [Centropristis striata]|uniref:butyrophilin-like protein 1 isoform X2 n=1 Tax=Centropristis striata TaxID=184440 RepID=UPI0027DF4B62|nr:butyrophilin-like protein 1 isoform X2 [Centropristis striata]
METHLTSVCCFLILSGITQGTGGQKVVVTEGKDVILPCSLSTKFSYFDWTKAAQKDEPRKEVFKYDAGRHYNNGQDGQSEEFKGRVSHFPEELKQGNASITIRNTKVTDSGEYTCVFPRLQPPQRFQMELIVSATPEPCIRTLKGPAGSALLQCEVQGAFPKPALEWRDSAGNKLPAEKTQDLERDGRFYITLQTTVTKADNYHCNVTQEEIFHQTSAETFVPLSVAVPEDTSHKVASGFFVGLAVGALIVLAWFKRREIIKICRKKGPKENVSDDLEPGKAPNGHPL